eukprot:scaffold148380_cov28-Tisochrysis_lutea.AAC.3
MSHAYSLDDTSRRKRSVFKGRRSSGGMQDTRMACAAHKDVHLWVMRACDQGSGGHRLAGGEGGGAVVLPVLAYIMGAETHGEARAQTAWTSTMRAWKKRPRQRKLDLTMASKPRCAPTIPPTTRFASTVAMV